MYGHVARTTRHEKCITKTEVERHIGPKRPQKARVWFNAGTIMRLSDINTVPRITIIDDEPAMRSYLAAELKGEGHQVDTADGKSALEVLDANDPPDLIISDVFMPGFNGFDVLVWVGENCPTVPVVMISGFADPHTHRRARQMGAAAFLDKPFEISELQQHVAELVGNGKGS
jgi:CheY-like chemotaxis protein